MDFRAQLFEGYVLPIVWQDAWMMQWVVKKRMNNMDRASAPWLAIALIAGHEHRLSPPLGGMNSGHFPPAPGCPSGIACPTFLLGVTMLSSVISASQAKTFAKKRYLESDMLGPQ